MGTTMETQMRLKDDLKVDKYALDCEWENHPLKYFEWAETHAKAILDRDNLKQKMDMLEAKLDKQLRVSLEKEFDKKPTEAAIKARICLDSEYSELQAELTKMNYNINILSAVKTAMDSKKKALEYLTQLHLSSYFSKPVVTSESKYKALTKRKEEDSKELSKKMRQRKSKIHG